MSSGLGAPQNKTVGSKNNRRPTSSDIENKNSSTPQEQQQSNVHWRCTQFSKTILVKLF
jgi:hypothetical protein